MKRFLYITVASMLAIPYMAYSALQVINPIDPDVVHVKKPNLFAAEWKKVSYSDDFTDYLDFTKIERGLDSTIEIVSMRNYFKTQTSDFTAEPSKYRSIVYKETVDCFNQTIVINKMYLLADHYARGSLVEEPLEDVSNPIKVRPGSVGLSMIKQACGLAYESSDPKYIKSSFMNSI
ncbi:hypothetical protein G6724_05545 [Polynucleobacter paneuropaeus]|nr:hypothetical protein [Polynucleobacter paneuropaeus]